MLENHGGEASHGVKSIWCERHLHKSKLIGIVALINFTSDHALPGGSLEGGRERELLHGILQLCWQIPRDLAVTTALLQPEDGLKGLFPL